MESKMYRDRMSPYKSTLSPIKGPNQIRGYYVSDLWKIGFKNNICDFVDEMKFRENSVSKLRKVVHNRILRYKRVACR